MTTEEKAKAYDEALERAKIWQNHLYETNDKDYADELNYIFPELVESEGERIKKNIKIALMSVEEELADFYSTHHTSQEELLAWLEKQGETYTNKDVDDAYLKGVCDTKQELEKQGEQNLANSAKTCKKSQRMVSAEAKEALYDKPATIDIDKMVDDYANNEEFGKPLNCMVGAYRQGLKDAIGKVVSESAWSEEDETNLTNTIIMLKEGASHRFTNFSIVPCVDWLKSIKQRIKGE